MKKQYRMPRLSPSEQEMLQMVLMEELEMQRWYAISCSELLDQEILFCLH